MMLEAAGMGELTFQFLCRSVVGEWNGCFVYHLDLNHQLVHWLQKQGSRGVHRAGVHLEGRDGGRWKVGGRKEEGRESEKRYM